MSGAGHEGFAAWGRVALPRWLPDFVAVVLVIVVSLVILARRLLDSFAFLNDDLVQFDVANRTGLSRELLVLNVFQHFSPFNRFFHWVIFKVALNATFGAIMSVGLVACLLGATAWLTYELGLSRFRRLIVVAATGGSLSVLDSAVWSDAALHILPALTATYLVIALHLRGLRTGRSGWHVASVVVFAAGLFTQERAGFALPLAVMIDVLLVWRDLPVSQRFTRLWAIRLPLVTMGLIGSSAAYMIHKNYFLDAGAPSMWIAAKTGLMALTNYQFPQLVGHQPSTFLTKPQQLLALTLIVLVAALLMAMNRRNIGPVLFFFGVFGLYWGFLVFSPILAEVYINGTAPRLHNAAYVTVPAYIAICSLYAPVTFSKWIHVRFSRWTNFTALGVVILTVGTLALAGNAYTVSAWTRYGASHAYWEGVRRTAAIWDDPGKTVLPLQGPSAVADAWAVPNGRQDQLLPFVEHGWKPGDLQAQTIILTESGQVNNAALQLVSTTEAAPPPSPGTTSGPGTPTCIQPASPSQTYSYVLDQPANVGPFLARIRYTADVAGQIRALPMSAGVSPEFNGLPTDLPAGTHEIVLQLDLDSIDSLWLDSMSAGSRICVHDLDVVRPVQVQPDGSCWLLDRYGERTGYETSCPERLHR